jgi:hypothetical protein
MIMSSQRPTVLARVLGFFKVTVRTRAGKTSRAVCVCRGRFLYVEWREGLAGQWAENDCRKQAHELFLYVEWREGLTGQCVENCREQAHEALLQHQHFILLAGLG